MNDKVKLTERELELLREALEIVLRQQPANTEELEQLLYKLNRIYFERG